MKLFHIITTIFFGAPIFSGPAFADALEGKSSPSEILARSSDGDWRSIPAENLIVLTLNSGEVLIALAPDVAPAHVANFTALANNGFYDGLSFYRVIDGFVAQGGDVFEERENGPAPLKAEFDAPLKDGVNFSPIPDADGYADRVGFHNSFPAGIDEDKKRTWLLHCAGALAMACDTQRDTAGAEFYFTLQPQRYLDRNLTVFGRVMRGMEHIQLLRRVSPPEEKDDDRGEEIVSMRTADRMAEPGNYELQILRTDTPLFAEYIESRRSRPEAFFYHRPGHVDVCAVPVPVRDRSSEGE